MASGERKTVSEQPRPKHYKDLLVLQRSMGLAKSVYLLTSKFLPEERYGLISQMRRAVISVPSNIAEGQARHGTKEFLQILSHAEGSLAEIETQLILSVELNFATRGEVDASLKEIDELQKMLAALRRKLSSFSPLTTRHSPLSPREH